MISNCQQKSTIQSPQRPQQTKQRQLNTCLLNSIKGKLSSTLDTKPSKQQSSLVNNSNKTSTMSTLTQDMRTAVVPATTVNSPKTNVKPPLGAVVVNSIIYSKPSFCTIAVDLGDLSGGKKPQTQSLCPKNIFHSETFCSPDMSFKTAASCLAGLMANSSASSSSSSLNMGDDAKVYRMCTTINGSIHHQISELCDNILAMAEMFKNHPNNKQEDDSFIEFNYDDDEDNDYLYHHDHHEEENEDEEDDDEDEDDDDDEEDILDDHVDYDDELDDDNDVVDFSYECPIEPAPKLNCDKKKKVIV